MVDFVSPGLMGRAREFNRYFAEQDEAAMARWTAAEQRARIEEANRRNAAVTAQQRDFLSQGGLMPELDGPFAGPGRQLSELGPTNQAASAVGAGLTPEQTAGNTQFARAMTARQPVDIGDTNRPAFNEVTTSTLRYSDLTPEQRRAWNDYAHALGMHQESTTPLQIRRQMIGAQADPAAVAAARERLRSLGLEVRNMPIGGEGNLSRGTFPTLVRVTPNYSEESLRFRTNEAGVQPSPATASGTTTALTNADVPRVLSGASLTGPRAGIRTPEDTASLRREGYDAEPGGAHEHGQAWDLQRNDGQAWDPASIQSTIEEFERNTGLTVNRQRSYQDRERGHLHLAWNGGGQAQPGARTQVAETRLEDDDYYQRVANVVGVLENTREMEMSMRLSNHLLNQAQLFAAHGDLAGSNASFASAMQQYNAYISQGRQAAYRAAAGGNLQAASWLVGEFYGYPEGAVAIRPTNERVPRFVLEINGQPSSPTPVTRDVLMNSLQMLTDREAALSNQEATRELLNNIRDNQTRYAIAQLESNDRRLGHILSSENNRLDNMTQMAIANGRPYLVTDTETGGVWVVYNRGVDERGEPVINSYRIAMEEQEVPDTRGRETRMMPVQRPTGIIGVGAE